MIIAKMNNIINKVCLTQGEVSKERKAAFEKVLQELPYLEHTCVKFLTDGSSYKTVSKILEVPVSLVKKIERKAVRHLRKPDRFYRLMMGEEKYAEWSKIHEGSTPVKSCNFTTRTKNTLERNGFVYIEELDNYIGNVPERFSYIEGLGKYGMSEILYYYAKRGGKHD